MLKKNTYVRIIIKTIRSFLIFFAIIGFAITCNFYLFFDSVNMTEAEIRSAAPVTFVNVVLLTLLFSVIDSVRRFYMVTKPVKRIQAAMDKIVAGDFDVRVEYINGENSDNEFDSIIKCLNNMTAELASVETLRTDFISNVSHEIKTPLTVIQNYGTMLQSPALTEEQRREYAKAITEQTKKLSELITNILKLNRLENQQIFPEKKMYNLTEQICECLLMFEYAWEKKNIELETDILEDVMIYQDEELLSLVWSNLFSNAIKFCNESGKVSVKISRQDDKIAVEVSDTGCGISPDVGKHIFEKFYQGDTSHATQGNGLGLALVKRVIDITGGDISVQSVLGQGTTFKVILEEKRIEYYG